MLQYLPTIPRVQSQQPQSRQQRQDLQSEQFSVLTKTAGRGNNKAVLISLRTPETNHELVEIQLMPSQEPRSKGEVTIRDNKEKRSVQLNTSMSEDYGNQYIQMYLLPNGEVKVEVKDAFYVIYDGAHIKLTTINQKFYGSVQGLCGTFNGDYYNDFLTPNNCILAESQDFVSAYTLNKKTQQTRDIRCTRDEVRLGDVISEQDIGRSSHSSDATKHHKSLRQSCTSHQHLYLEEPGMACFTTRKMPVCKQECTPKKVIQKNVKVFCVQKSETTDAWAKQIQSGSGPNFSLKEATKTKLMDVPISCQRF